MSNIDIYAILSSKPHNQHYLKRYWKFIQWCQLQNNSEQYTEAHHICPKSSDLFPEYKSFIENSWNRSDLTDHQHFLAHWMLWKAYGGKQTFAFTSMCNNWHPDGNKRKTKTLNGKTFSELKENSRDVRKQYSSYRNTTTGEVVYAKISENLMSTGNYVGTSKGTKKPKEYVETLKGVAAAKTKSGETLGRISLTDPRWKTGEIVGSNRGTKKRNDRIIVKHAKHSHSGEYAGSFPPDDPRWLSGELISITKNNVAAVDSKTLSTVGMVDKSDPRWKTGEIVSYSSCYRAAKITTTGEYIGYTLFSDPRWATGEIVHNNSGKKESVLMFSVSLDRNIRVSVDDPRIETGELTSSKSPRSGSAMDVKTGKRLGSVSIDDPRWKTGEIVGTSKGQRRDSSAKKKLSDNKKGKCSAFCVNTGESLGWVSTDDPRWKSKEIVGSTSKLRPKFSPG